MILDRARDLALALGCVSLPTVPAPPARPAPGSAGIQVFGRGCGPVATWPRLRVTRGAPRIGTAMTLTGSLLQPRSPGITAIGLSNTTFGGLRLPWLLDGGVFPPCRLLVSLDLIVPGSTDANGNQALAFGIPNDRRLIGLHVYTQMATLGRQNHLTDGLDLQIE